MHRFLAIWFVILYGGIAPIRLSKEPNRVLNTAWFGRAGYHWEYK